MFRPRNPDDRISPEAIEVVGDVLLENIRANEDFRRKVITALMSDDVVASEIAETLFAVKAKDVGLMTSGSIADLFRKRLGRNRKKKASKTSK
jgi:hypothetical protein